MIVCLFFSGMKPGKIKMTYTLKLKFTLRYTVIMMAVIMIRRKTLML